MSTLEIRLCGPPRVERDGEPVQVDTRKAIALLAYLALDPIPHRRETVVGLLWPDAAPDRGRAALRRTLSVLRKALDGRWLQARTQILQLDRDGVDLDMDALSVAVRGCPDHAPRPDPGCAGCVRLAEAAVSRCRGEFMEGFALRDSPEFDDWLTIRAEETRRQLGSVLRMLARSAEDRGDLATAMEHVHRRLRIDPLDEASHRHLMQLFVRAGDRSAALRQYRECVLVLDRELGVAPLDETTQLYDAIREDRSIASVEVPAVPTATPPLHPPVDPRTYPLVGRDGEMQELLRSYERAQPDGCLVVVEGEPGIGKTRLVEELVATARARGGRALVARCHDGEAGIPYGSVIDLVRQAAGWTEEWMPNVGEPWLTEAARLLPELNPAPALPAGPVEGPAARARLLEAVSRVITAAAGGAGPGVVVLDDAHWADEASVDAIAYLARRLQDRPVLVALTWRTEDVADDHPLRAVLSSLRRSGRALHLRPGRLSAGDVAELARAAGRQDAGGQPFSLELFDQTEGLPLFVVEYLAMAGREEPDGQHLPGGVADVLRSRIAGLSERARQVVAAAAVVGGSFDAEVLRDASGRTDDETVDSVEELAGRGIIAASRADGSGQVYDFAHHKLREFVYRQTTLARRRLLHRRIAESLSRRRRDADPLAAVVARHYLAAGDEQKSAGAFVRAGEHARALYANAEALEHFRNALALGHDRAGALHEAVGDLLVLQGDYAQAVASYETAAAMSGSGDMGRIEHRLGMTHLRRGDLDAARFHLEAALACHDEEQGADSAMVLSDLSLVALRHGDLRRAAQTSRRALSEATSHGGARARAQAHNISGMIASRRGRADEAMQHLALSLEAARASGESAATAAALNNLALVHRAAGRLDEALSHTREALALCIAEGDRHREAALRNNLADLLRAAGDTESAMEELKRAVAIFAEVGGPDHTEPEVWKLVDW